MYRETTAQRLKKIMKEQNLKQVDILRLAQPYCKEYDVKLLKSDLSQFVSGKVVPGQHKLVILALALNVSEPWLMGYDVPMHRTDDSNTDNISLTPHEKKVITAYRNNPNVRYSVDKLLDIADNTAPKPSSDDIASDVFSELNTINIIPSTKTKNQK